MFVDPVICNTSNPILELIARIQSPDPDACPEQESYIRRARGIYEIGHFSFEFLISKNGGNLSARNADEWNPYAEDLPHGLNAYGVCDSIMQFIQDFGLELESSPRELCASFTEIRKVDMPEAGGWRWHKWGPYVGRGEPTTEYLYDEPAFDAVWVYHLFVRETPCF